MFGLFIRKVYVVDVFYMASKAEMIKSRLKEKNYDYMVIDDVGDIHVARLIFRRKSTANNFIDELGNSILQSKVIEFRVN